MGMVVVVDVRRKVKCSSNAWFFADYEFEVNRKV